MKFASKTKKGKKQEATESIGTKQPFFMKMDKSLMTRIDFQCDRLGMKRSAFIRMAIVKLLEEEEFRSNHQ